MQPRICPIMPIASCRTSATREHRQRRPWFNGYLMTQPVLFKQSFLIAMLAVVQAVHAGGGGRRLAVCDHHAVRQGVRPSSEAIVIVAVLCLVLIQPPREVTTQTHLCTHLRRHRRDFPLAAAARRAAGRRLCHEVFDRLSAPRIHHLGGGHAGGADVIVTLLMQEVMHRFLMNAFDNRSAIFAGYNNSSLELARRLTNNPAMRLKVSGFFDDRSPDRLGQWSPMPSSSAP
jgi:hypothetical protein